MHECNLLQLLIFWNYTLSIFNILCGYETMTVLFLTVVFPVGAVQSISRNCHVTYIVRHYERKFWATVEQEICVLPSLWEGYGRSSPSTTGMCWPTSCGSLISSISSACQHSNRSHNEFAESSVVFVSLVSYQQNFLHCSLRVKWFDLLRLWDGSALWKLGEALWEEIHFSLFLISHLIQN